MASQKIAGILAYSKAFWRCPWKNMRQYVRWDLISGSLGIDAGKAETDYNNQHQFDLANKDLSTYNEGIEKIGADTENQYTPTKKLGALGRR